MNKRRLRPDEQPSSSGEHTSDHDRLACYICGKLYHSGKARILHVKMCARSKGISTPQLIAMIKQSRSLTEQEEKELRNNRELLAECDELFKKQPASKGGNTTKKKRVTYYNPVVAMEEEELQMALAISASLSEQEIYFQQQLEDPPKQEANDSLLSPAAPASSDFVESRTDALLCPKTSCDNKRDKNCINDRCSVKMKNSEHSLSENLLSCLPTADTVGSTDGNISETIQTDTGDVKVTHCSPTIIPCERERHEDKAKVEFTMWNATCYSENESTEFFYVLPSLK